MRQTNTFFVLLLLAWLPGFSGGDTHAENIDPADGGWQYAWAENVGWLNAEPNGDGGDGVEVGDFELTGWIWGENIGWISLSCQNTASCGTVDYGVTNDGHGNLGGFAWAENVGWINFDPSTSDASIDPTTGRFSGYLWGENIGWINLSCANTGSCGTVSFGIETDWCQAVPTVPPGTPTLAVTRSGSDVALAWTGVPGAGWYEVVRGRLGVLHSSGGDFTASMDSCGVDNQTGTSAIASGTPEPPLRDAYWYLVRGVNCKGKGTYDSGGTGQAGPRDAGIAGSGSDCP